MKGKIDARTDFEHGGSHVAGSPYLTMREAVAFLHFSTASAARRFIRHAGIPFSWRGRVALVRRDTLEHYLETCDCGMNARVGKLRSVVGLSLVKASKKAGPR